MKLKYFKIETFGAVDGPGVRLLAFAQGCPYKCIYCHNPESQTCNGNKYISVSKIIKTYQKHKNFYTNGGITISGGEPLLQKNFCLSIAKRCYRKGISLAFDTSAATFSDANLKFFKKLIKYKPLFLIDIKSMDINMHKKITGSSNLNELALINFLESNKCHY
jgi:pyruvate formate lyase activating enzyme